MTINVYIARFFLDKKENKVAIILADNNEEAFKALKSIVGNGSFRFGKTIFVFRNATTESVHTIRCDCSSNWDQEPKNVLLELTGPFQAVIG